MSFETIFCFAPAKINLTLHIHGRREDGYHELSSVVMFANVGDRLWLSPHFSFLSDQMLTISGPFGADLARPHCDAGRNLVQVIAENYARLIGSDPFFKFELEKNLPVSSGIGGGSCDAAAALRALIELANRQSIGRTIEDSELKILQMQTGADIPVCFQAQTCFMQGIGEKITPLTNKVEIPALLVNPGVAVSTKEVFASLGAPAIDSKSADFYQKAEIEKEAFNGVSNVQSMLDHVQVGCNDMQQAAIKQQPVIQNVLDEICQLNGCRIARMSGSGATCFGLFEHFRDAKNASLILQDKFPEWWVVETVLGQELENLEAETKNH